MMRPSCPMNGFEEFWPAYVYSHRNQVNRILHLVGTLSVVPNFMIASQVTWWWLAMVPLVAYTFSWMGHLVFEGNKPATFDYPLWSLRGDFRMCALMLIGKMGDELDKVGNK